MLNALSPGEFATAVLNAGLINGTEHLVVYYTYLVTTPFFALVIALIITHLGILFHYFILFIFISNFDPDLTVFRVYNLDDVTAPPLGGTTCFLIVFSFFEYIRLQ